jgi:hypothetical protein
MTYGIVTTITGDGSMYDKLHGELLQRTGGEIAGLLLHIGRTTERGFQVIEVWESKDQFDRANHDIVWPLASQILGNDAVSAPVATEEFEPRGLVIPAVGRTLAE